MGLHASKSSDTERIIPYGEEQDDKQRLVDGEKVNGIGEEARDQLPPKTEFKVYKRRFYVLGMFTIASIFQTIFWNTWSPIADTAIAVFGWHKGDIALLTAWGGIISIFFCIPFAGIMDKYGIRKMFLLAETFALIGVGVRCIPVGAEHMKWTANLGQLIIAFAGPFLVQGPPLVSVVWFPPHQRTTSTAIATIFMEFGVAISFLMGPFIVKEPKTVNATILLNQTDDMYVYEWIEDDLPAEVKQKHIDEINHLLYIEFGMIVILYITAWLYFPAKPPSPPSVSASRGREDFIPGAKILVKSLNAFWLPALCYSISLGVFGTWATQLDVMFKGTIGVGQDIASWIAFYTYTGALVGGVMSGRCVDYLGGKMRLVLLALTGPAIFVFVWFLLICYKAIDFNLPSLYVSATAYGFLLYATKPLYLEVVVEGVYPVAEGIAIGLKNWINNFIGICFLFVMMIPNIGVYWMNWTVLGSIIVTFLILLVFKEEDKRLALDKAINQDTKSSGHLN